MSIKLKALGLSLLATLAMSAVAVMNASATAGGHFVSAVPHTEIKGTEGGDHVLHLLQDPPTQDEIGCDVESYTGTTSSETTESITITPLWSQCYTTGTENKFDVRENGCDLTFTVAKGTTDSTEQTVHLTCPTGNRIEVPHPNCTVSIHPQTVSNAVTYTTTAPGGIHEITMDVNATFSVTRHGLCQFILPTNGFGILDGSVTVKGFDKDGNQVGITAT